MHVKVSDTVEVLTGDDRGMRAEVLSVDRKVGKVIVQGVNLVYKHVRRSQRNPQGGRLSKEMPIPLSNVRLVCPKCSKAARTGVRIDREGAKFRFCKKCGAEIGQISPPHPRRAAQVAASR
jgi:large subunit ribosomal protein L24